MMKLINTFKGGLLKIGVIFELFKVGVLKSSPIKAFTYVWGLGWIEKLVISLNTILILISISSGDWGSAVVSISIVYLFIGAAYYLSKYCELLKSLQGVKDLDKPATRSPEGYTEVERYSDDDNLLGDYLRSVTKKSEDGRYSIYVDGDFVNNTKKDN